MKRGLKKGGSIMKAMDNDKKMAKKLRAGAKKISKSIKGAGTNLMASVMRQINKENLKGAAMGPFKVKRARAKKY